VFGNEYNAAARGLLSVPHEKSAYDYNISTGISASLDSIAAVANDCCCIAFPSGRFRAPDGI
jgi:hypothetical protein